MAGFRQGAPRLPGPAGQVYVGEKSRKAGELVAKRAIAQAGEVSDPKELDPAFEGLAGEERRRAATLRPKPRPFFRP